MTITRNQFIDEWQKDLRCGKYKQSKGCLSDSKDNYCCLGVACKTGHRLGIQEASLDTGEQDPDDAMPGDWFRDLMGSFDPTVRTEGEYEDEDIEHLTTLNDEQDWDFDMIADGLDQLREEE